MGHTVTIMRSLPPAPDPPPDPSPVTVDEYPVDGMVLILGVRGVLAGVGLVMRRTNLP